MTASSHSSPSSSCCRLCSCRRRDRSRLFGGLALLFGDGLGFPAPPPTPALAELDLTWPLTALISLLTVKQDIFDISNLDVHLWGNVQYTQVLPLLLIYMNLSHYLVLTRDCPQHTEKHSPISREVVVVLVSYVALEPG